MQMALVSTSSNLLQNCRSMHLSLLGHSHFALIIVICNFMEKMHQITTFKMKTEILSCLSILVHLCECTVKWYDHKLWKDQSL